MYFLNLGVKGQLINPEAAISLFQTVLFSHGPPQWSVLWKVHQDKLEADQLEAEAGLPLPVQARGGLVRLLAQRL